MAPGRAAVVPSRAQFRPGTEPSGAQPAAPSKAPAGDPEVPMVTQRGHQRHATFLMCLVCGIATSLRGCCQTFTQQSESRPHERPADSDSLPSLLSAHLSLSRRVVKRPKTTERSLQPPASHLLHPSLTATIRLPTSPPVSPTTRLSPLHQHLPTTARLPPPLPPACSVMHQGTADGPRRADR